LFNSEKKTISDTQHKLQGNGLDQVDFW